MKQDFYYGKDKFQPSYSEPTETLWLRSLQLGRWACLDRPVHATDIFKAVAHLHLPLNLQLLNVLSIGNYHNDQKVTTKHGYDA